MLLEIFERRPNSRVVFADFDWLPPPDIDAGSGDADRTPPAPAAGDPLVTDMRGADHPDYLRAPPLCDVLFPTDFGRLAAFASRATRPRTAAGGAPPPVAALKQRDFLLRYGAAEVERTRGWSGYSPLVDDFGNCSVLVVG